MLVCVGGLLDGDLIVRAQMLLGGKTPCGCGPIADVKPEHRLSERNPPSVATWWWPKARSRAAILNQSDGVLLQELPFAVELKKFIVEHYSTGMPKLFASEIIIHDKATGENTSPCGGEPPASWKGHRDLPIQFDDGAPSSSCVRCPWRPGPAV